MATQFESGAMPAGRATEDAPLTDFETQIGERGAGRDFEAESDFEERPIEPRQPDQFDQIARALGWFSVALGAAQLVAPRGLSRAIGIGEHPLMMRGLGGARELTAGVGLLSAKDPAPWVWGRVAGDILDIAMLGTALRGGRRPNTVAALVAVLGVTALDLYAAQGLARRRREELGVHPGEAAIPIEKSTTINRSPEECYRYWRQFENLPRFMKHIESVREIDERRSHWVARSPLGMRVEWESELTEDRPNEYMAWRALPGSTVENEGWVRFDPAPAGRGTIVRVEIRYRPPGGFVGDAAARLTGQSPEHQVQEDLRRFKRLLETGEIPTTEGQPHGRRSLLARATPGGTAR